MHENKTTLCKNPNPDFKSAITAQESVLIDISVKTSARFSLAVKKKNSVEYY